MSIEETTSSTYLCTLYDLLGKMGNFLSVWNCHCHPWKSQSIHMNAIITRPSSWMNAILTSLNMKLEISASASSKRRIWEEEAQQLGLVDMLRPNNLTPKGFSYKEDFTIHCYKGGVNHQRRRKMMMMCALADSQSILRLKLMYICVEYFIELIRYS